MNKNFEKEYLEYSAKDTPDLWSRIEAGIDEIESRTVTDEDSKTDNRDSNVIPITAKPKKSIKRYAGLIAAAACVVIAIPAIILISKNSGSNFAASAPTADYASEAPATSFAATAAATDSDDADYYEEAACEEPMYEDSEVYTESAVADDFVRNNVEKPAEAAEAFNGDAKLATSNTASKSAASEDGSGTRTYEDEEELVKGCWGSECDVHNIDSDIVYYADIPWEEGVVITPQEELTDFKVMKINITGVTDYGEIIYDSEEIYNIPEVSPDLPILLLVEFMGDLPEYAISFKDAYGVEYIMSVSISGMDGSIVLDWIN